MFILFSFRPEALQMITRDSNKTLEFIQSRIDFIDYLYEKKEINKSDFGLSELFGKEIPMYTNPEFMLFLDLNEYMLQRYFYYWTSSFYVDNSREGWKTHISILTDEEYSFMCHYILPVLRENKIDHKIVRPDEVQMFNEHDTQKGKILTIYPESLDFLKLFEGHCRKFLLEDNGLRVPTDLHLGGKVYTRYTAYSHDYVTNPATGERVYMERKEGFYKPEWIEEPQRLYEILNKEEINHV